MTDSISMWLSQFNSTGLKEFKKRLEISTAYCTSARNYPSNRKKVKRETAFRETAFVRLQVITLT